MATFLNDTLTDTNGVLLTAHTGETGATWAKETGQTGVFTVQTNRIYCSTTNACYYSSGVPVHPDYEVTGTVEIITAANNEVGIVGRAATGAVTHYWASLKRVSSGGGTWSLNLNSYVNGTANSLGTYACGALTGTHTIKLRMVGNQISVYLDGTLRIGPVTDTAVTAAGRAGVRAITAVTTTTGFHIADISAAEVIGKVDTVTDAFDTKDTTKWTWPASTTVTNGQAVNTPSGAAVYDYVTSNLYYDLTASSVAIKLAQPLGGNSTAESGIRFRPSAGNLVTIFVTGAATKLLKMREQVSAVNDDTQVNYDPVEHKYLRLREAGGTTYWETSPTGKTGTWTTQRSKASGLTLTSGQISFYGYWASGATPNPESAIFDNVNIPLNTGTSSGTLVLALSSAVGARTPKGTSTPAYTFATSAIGEAPVSIPTGTSSGTLSFAISAVGKENSKGTTSSTLVFIINVTGRRTPKGQKTATITLATNAVGEAPPNNGSASSTISFAISAVGEKICAGTTSTTIALETTTVGERTPKGQNTTAITLATSAAGDTPPNRGMGTVAITLATNAVGEFTAEGTTSSTIALAITAIGKLIAKGQQTSVVALASSAIGQFIAKGQKTSTIALATSVVGEKAPIGTASAVIALETNASGVAPIPGVKQGAGSATLRLAGSATGTRNSSGTSSSNINLAISAIGEKTCEGVASSGINFETVASSSIVKEGSASSSIVLATGAIGQRKPKAVTVATIDLVGQGVGKKICRGQSSSTITLITTIIGYSGIPGHNAGQSHATCAWITTATGIAVAIPLDRIIVFDGDKHVIKLSAKEDRLIEMPSGNRRVIMRLDNA